MGEHIINEIIFIMKTFALCTLVASLAFYTLAVPQDKNVITCTICTDLVTILDENLTNNATISEIESFLDAACDILVGMEQDCKDFVAANLETVIDLLVMNMSAPMKSVALSRCAHKSFKLNKDFSN